MASCLPHRSSASQLPAPIRRYRRRCPARAGLFNAATWAAGPFGPGAAATVPHGASPAAQPAVDVFYVHPTTSKSRKVWNQDMADAAENRWVDESVVARQASVFSDCCRVFSPRYRAATAKAFASPAGRDAAFALAYSDIERAFDWYLAHENQGRPFIIAGHSQGAFHMATLLERRIDGTPAAAPDGCRLYHRHQSGRGRFRPAFPIGKALRPPR